MMDIRSRPRVIHSATGTKDLQMVCFPPCVYYSLVNNNELTILLSYYYLHNNN